MFVSFDESLRCNSSCTKFRIRDVTIAILIVVLQHSINSFCRQAIEQITPRILWGAKLTFNPHWGYPKCELRISTYYIVMNIRMDVVTMRRVDAHNGIVDISAIQIVDIHNVIAQMVPL
jgi:hypothetical protein